MRFIPLYLYTLLLLFILQCQTNIHSDIVTDEHLEKNENNTMNLQSNISENIVSSKKMIPKNINHLATNKQKIQETVLKSKNTTNEINANILDRSNNDDNNKLLKVDNRTNLIQLNELKAEAIIPHTNQKYKIKLTKDNSYYLLLEYPDQVKYSIIVQDSNNTNIPLITNDKNNGNEYILNIEEDDEYIITISNISDNKIPYLFWIKEKTKSPFTYKLNEGATLQTSFKHTETNTFIVKPLDSGEYLLDLQMPENMLHEVYIYDDQKTIISYTQIIDVNSTQIKLLLVKNKKYSIEIKNTVGNNLLLISLTKNEKSIFTIIQTTINHLINEYFNTTDTAHWYQVKLKSNTIYKVIYIGSESLKSNLYLFNSNFSLIESHINNTEESKYINFTPDTDSIFNIKIERISGDGKYSLIVLEENNE